MHVLISQMQELFRVHDGPRIINEKHIEQWSHSYGLNRASLYDAIAAELALGFHNGTLDYEFCDAVVNDLVGIHFEEDNSLFWQVFLAFDAGEYGHDGDRGVDPVEKYTRPEITRIVSKLTA